MISMRSARMYLAALWLLFGGLIIVLVSVQSTRDFYGEATQDVWDWLVPTIVPTMTLVIGVLVAEVRTPRPGEYKVGKLLYVIAFALSSVYLAYLLWVIVDASHNLPALNVMRRSSFGLGILQSLTALALGAFFVQANPQADAS